MSRLNPIYFIITIFLIKYFSFDDFNLRCKEPKMFNSKNHTALVCNEPKTKLTLRQKIFLGLKVELNLLNHQELNTVFPREIVKKLIKKRKTMGYICQNRDELIKLMKQKVSKRWKNSFSCKKKGPQL